MWTYWICDTITGSKLLQVSPAKAPWSRLLNAGGKGSSVFVLEGDEPMKDKALSSPWSRTIVYCWDGTPIYAGIIITRKYDQPSHRLTLTHSDIRALLAKRFPFGASSYWANEAARIPGKLTITSKTWRAAAAAVVLAGGTGVSANYALPIVLPSVSEAGGISTVYENYNFQRVTDLLEDIQSVNGGPDIDFEPIWSGAGTLQWLMRTGNLTVPQIAGNVFDFNMSVEKPRLTGLGVTEDGTKMITGMFGIGQGSEADMRVGGAGVSGTSTLPALDEATSYKTEISESLLASYGLGRVLANSSPTKQWEMGMLATEEPGLVSLRLGSILRVMTKGDPWIADGTTEVRLVSMSGDEGNHVSLDVQTWG